MSRIVSVVGAPSSAGAYAPGQEEAPAALRAAGLIGLLRSGTGCEVRDTGDLPGFRWRPDRIDRAAQNLAEVAATVIRVRDAVAPMLRGGRFALVLGGDCTVGVGTVAGSVAAGGDTGVVYLDMHADLNVPASVPDGALDWMGVAHMLAVDGSRPELRDAGPRTPLLDPANIVVLGHDDGQATAWERETIHRLGVTCVPAEALEPIRPPRPLRRSPRSPEDARASSSTSTSMWSTSSTRRCPRTRAATSAFRWTRRSLRWPRSWPTSGRRP